MNCGLLPEGYYALSEQHAGLRIPDVITLHMPGFATVESRPSGDGGVALVEAPPLVRRRLVASPEMSYRALRRTLAIRRKSGHRLVAMVEIASPGNKDRLSSVSQFAEKVQAAITSGVHVLLVDVHRSGKHDPLGLHGAIWSFFDAEEETYPRDQSAWPAISPAGFRRLTWSTCNSATRSPRCRCFWKTEPT